MKRRHMTSTLLAAARSLPIVTVTGPRQSGKTTLVRTTFPDHDYCSLEDPDTREYALSDPRGFLGQFRGPAILDEAQRAPELFSYLQAMVDEDQRPGRFILTGSQNFLLLRSISQSLAGRTSILHLLPFSLAELREKNGLAIEDVGRRFPEVEADGGLDLFTTLISGFYPRIHDQELDPQACLRDYSRTYVERDVREIVNVGDLDAFSRFVRLCAGRNGQLLNLSSLATDCGITHTTARRWLSILEASFLVMLLRPHHRNFSKRLIRTPKLYFIDTGLLCYLLRIRTTDDLRIHASRGAVFESFVLSELLKMYLHRGLEPDLFFWRDSAGHEVDVILDDGTELRAVEVKSGQTLTSDAFAGLRYWQRLAGDAAASLSLVYGGDRSSTRSGVLVYRWFDI